MKVVIACTLISVVTVALPSRLFAGDKAAAKPTKVTIKSLSYEPKQLDISVGESVLWANVSRTKHTATSDDEGKTFDTGEIKPGQESEAVKFEKDGEFKYHCKVHGKTMSGTIIVKPAKQ